MDRDTGQAVREVCLWLPETAEFLSHGSPNFRVRGKTFATYVVNHHGDGRVALWLNTTPTTQHAWVSADPRRFFVPPYVGPRGWLGVHLDKGLSWRRIAELVREAYERTAPLSLSRTLGRTPPVVAPRSKMSVAEIDPWRGSGGKALLRLARAVCLKFPEVREARQFGNPVWQAGKKTFAGLRRDGQGYAACFWVGVEQQRLLTLDSRYRIPSFQGHLGWIEFAVSEPVEIAEFRELAAHSYRHFALRRMLAALEPDAPRGA